jgi:hypothetical protein
MRPLLLCAAVALVLAAPAAAKVWFLSVRGDTYGVGQVVRTEIAGCPTPCPVRGTQVWLGRSGSNRLVRLGVVDRRGVLVFRIPNVRAGTYHLATSGRRVSDSFRVRG